MPCKSGRKSVCTAKTPLPSPAKYPHCSVFLLIRSRGHLHPLNHIDHTLRNQKKSVNQEHQRLLLPAEQGAVHVQGDHQQHHRRRVVGRKHQIATGRAVHFEEHICEITLSTNPNSQNFEFVGMEILLPKRFSGFSTKLFRQ